MAHTKAAGTSRLGRDSQPKYLGVKLFAGQKARPGSIIIRQRGTKFKPGKNVKRGNDDTLYSLAEGIVQFATKKVTKFDRSRREAKIVNVILGK
jgi:large subunit ribosomal protein L27